MGINIFEKSVRIVLERSGILIDRPSAGFDFYAGMPCDKFLFDTWTSYNNFYEKIVIGVFYKGKIRYIPCLKSSFISESTKKAFQLDLEFYYKNTLYTFLWSGQWASKLFGSQNIDYFLNDYVSVKFKDYTNAARTNEVYSFTVSTDTEIPQRFGMSYKWKFYAYNIYYKKWEEKLSLFNCKTSATVFNGKYSDVISLCTYSMAAPEKNGSPDENYDLMIKAVSEIETEYCLIGIKIKSAGVIYPIKYNWEKNLNVEAGTYTIENLFSELSNYIAENSYRVLASGFTITDGNFTISMKAGQRIWLCSEGESPNYAKAIRFVDDDGDYSGKTPEYELGYQNYNFYGNGSTGFAKVYKAKGRYGSYINVSSYNVTVTSGISFL
nr:MAG TPA: hypothetical protein [Caudoviricetes sp.]